jgi:prepilin-type N-terminal cleavage/methylation domain-containing protein
MTFPTLCHCEERSDEAISTVGRGDCFATLAVTGDYWPQDSGWKKTRLANPQSAIRNLKSPRGVTLTEVIVASALLLVCIAPLLKALTLAQVADRAIERKSWSLMQAQRELEWIRARCLRHYETCYRVNSKAVGEGYLCTVTDDADPTLRTVTVAVGLDQNGDGVLSAGEVEVRLTTRLAR